MPQIVVVRWITMEGHVSIQGYLSYPSFNCCITDMDLLLEHLEVARWMEVLSRVVLAHGIFRRRRWIPPLFQMKDESAMLG
jgi:hypothetical protein